MKQDIKQTIPEQKTGNESNTESVAELKSEKDAARFFTIVKQRLLDVNHWQDMAGAATAHFQLTDEKGQPVQRTPQKGDYFKIDIPGPGSSTGDGYDWVQVEAIEEINNEQEQSIAIRARPASNPTNNQQDVAHFFDDEATSNFIIQRKGNKVSAAVLGRNEKPNTDAEKMVDKARNTAVALGAAAAFSKLQWKSLVNGLVKQEDD